METQSKSTKPRSLEKEESAKTMPTSIDINDLMDEIDSRKFPPKDLSGNDFNGNVNYDSLLRSISDIGKLIDQGDKFPGIAGNCDQEQDITADLFATMSDSEMLSHFIPVRGVDFDRFQSTDDQLKKHEEKNKIGVVVAEPVADEFQLHRVLPHLNPLYHLSNINQLNSSAFKSPVSENVKIGGVENKTQEEEEEEEQQEYEQLELDVENPMSPQSNADSITSTEERTKPRPIKRRKPRTYKYNPKPLQHKECRAFVPDDLKDIDYWAHRKRNNEAAKKSREERRKKELEILNSYEIMKQEYSQIKIENIRLKARNFVLEKQVSDLKCKASKKK